MKLRAVICFALSTLLLIAGCSQSSNGPNTAENHDSVQTDRSNAESRNDKSAADQNDVKDHSSTASTPKLGSLNQTLQAIQKQLNDQKQLFLPDYVPIEDGKYRSAVVTEQASDYSVTFKQTNTPAAVNDPSLAHAKTIAAIRARTFQNKNDAAKQIKSQHIQCFRWESGRAWTRYHRLCRCRGRYGRHFMERRPVDTGFIITDLRCCRRYRFSA